MATRLPRTLDDQDPVASDEGEPRPHWLATGLLVGGAMWVVLIAVVVAAFGNWLLAGCLLGVAAILVLGLLLTFRRARRSDRQTGL